VIHTNDIEYYYEQYKSKGVIDKEIKTFFWGKQVTFSDLYGNTWCLVLPTEEPYVNKLGFHVIEDKTYGDSNYRWLLIGPDKNLPALTIVKANDEETSKKVGTQSFLMNVSDLNSFYEHATKNDVQFHMKPTAGFGGSDAQFKDLYGNSWNAREHSKELRK